MGYDGSLNVIDQVDGLEESSISKECRSGVVGHVSGLATPLFTYLQALYL
ncbi:hypothetical protein FOWG_16981 [Fusarium oxysporum f. sp. lycopersici MN25]|nr:hypothetical protein FOWG_17342 [Fusarium oxysporum f. sp. lycopersici MN25]EWZ78822.1 hypothetical protein FOWG_16981 [Fusarium oxysporum f. sp. lycopersici MN25]